MTTTITKADGTTRKIKVGDTVTVRILRAHDVRKVVRMVTHIERGSDGRVRVGVPYGGWRPFWLNPMVDTFID